MSETARSAADALRGRVADVIDPALSWHVARIPAEYRHHALAIRALLRDLAKAEVARERATPLLEEFGPIEGPELARDLSYHPEEIVERTEVTLWAINGRIQPLPEERQGEVRPIAGTNQGQVFTDGHPVLCVRQRFNRIRYREPIASPSNNGSLLRYVNLPAFYAYGGDFVTAERGRGPLTALEHLSRDLVERAVHERPVHQRWEPVQLPYPDEARRVRVVRTEDAA